VVVRILAAVDKFRGTATAHEVAAAIGDACWDLGHEITEVPLADGGEGLLEVFGGPNRSNRVTGPLGTPVDAGWRIDGRTAIIEMALASGLTIAGGAEQNRPLDATTAGVGELILAAVAAGARRIIVGLGGSATTDGGLGAVQAIGSPGRIAGIDLLVACDVTTVFADAAPVFAPQKGASPAEVKLLQRRLESLAQQYLDDYGVDVSALPGSGAAGGLAGGLVALGGRIEPGFNLVADEAGLHDALEHCDLVITAEGHLDAQSFEGKVVGGVAELAAARQLPVAVICGIADADVADRLPTIAIADRYGIDRALREPRRCIADAARELISQHSSR
jgi:glycerate kinase